MKKRKVKKKVFAKILLVICIGGILFSGFNIFRWVISVNANKHIKDNTNKLVKVKKGKYKVDFNELIKKNDETIAYLKVNDTDIKYVVVKADDNNYYLRHNFNKKRNIAGWIFADYRNKFDNSDKNIIIYGHNMKDTSMFGTLKNVIDDTWNKKKKNHYISLITMKKNLKYQIFSSYMIDPEDYYLTTDFNSYQDFEKFTKKLTSRSVYDYKVSVDGSDKILTLSTCNDDGSKRIVVHAKLVKESNNS